VRADEVALSVERSNPDRKSSLAAGPEPVNERVFAAPPRRRDNGRHQPPRSHRMEKQIFSASDKLQPPVGLYSRAIRVGDLLFISGHAAFDKQGNVVGVGDAAAQTEQILKNIQALLEEAGASFDNIVKSTTYLVNVADLPKVSEVKKRFYRQPYPTSASVEVKGLARPELLVEIDAIAAL
jgi:reactive intermediate/imine deaminase